MDEVADERCSVMLLVTLHHDQVLVSIMTCVRSHQNLLSAAEVCTAPLSDSPESSVDFRAHRHMGHM